MASSSPSDSRASLASSGAASPPAGRRAAAIWPRTRLYRRRYQAAGSPTLSTEAKPLDGGALACKGTLEAAGHLAPIEFTAHVQDFTDRAVTMTANLVADRLRFGMTWSPMRIAAYDARGTVTARFVRA